MYVYQGQGGKWYVATLTSLQFTAPELWRLFIEHHRYGGVFDTESSARQAKHQIECDCGVRWA